MMKGARKATGEWIIFRNVGDYFYSKTVVEDVFSEYEDHGESLIIGGTRYFVNHYFSDKFRNYPQKSYFEEDPAHHTSTFIRRVAQLKYPYPEKYKYAADCWFFITVLRNNDKFCKTNKIIGVYDNRKGATADNYDQTLKEIIDIFKSYGAPPEIVEHLKKRLKHLLTVKKRRRFFLFNIFYKFTRWYFGYYRGGWHKYNSLPELFG